MKKLEDYVISIPDFPKPGILFRDVTGVLASGEGFR
ncbi:MAG: adenine phosphoribosyltransferase, partial [bacterium]|nr:adenine phosphoribosyltransferase [bacterium]